MRIDEVIDIVKQMFSLNGFHKEGLNIKLKNPTEITISVITDGVKISFGKDTYPLATYQKDLVVIKPQLTRKVSSILFTDDKIVVGIENFPDFTLNYS